ncbi:acyltransferase family protein [Eisenbergiella sp.]
MNVAVNSKMGGVRLEWLDLFKGYAMLMIVLSHTNVPKIYYSFFSPVFLSGFFFASGYTFNKRRNFGSFIAHKLRTQAWPFATLGIINSILAVTIENDNIFDRMKFLISRNGHWDDMWFIACLIMSEVIFYGILLIIAKCKLVRSKSKDAAVLVLSFIVSIGGLMYVRYIGAPLPWQFENACLAMVFLAFGYLYRKYEKFYIKYEQEKALAIVLIIYILTICLFPNDVSVHLGKYDSWLLYVAEAIIGIATLILFCKLFAKYVNKTTLLKRWLIFIGSNTLVYYAFQSKAIKLAYLIYNKLGFAFSEYVISIAVMLIVAVAMVLPAWIIKKYFPFILNFPTRSHHINFYHFTGK